MAQKILTSVDMTEDTAFPPKVNWCSFNNLILEDGVGLYGKQCYTVKKIKDNYLVESYEDDNKLATANDLQEKDVEAYQFSINVKNKGTILQPITPTSIEIIGTLGTIVYDSFDSKVMEWSNFFHLPYNVVDNYVTFPTAYVEKNNGSVSIDESGLTVTVTYEDGSNSTFDRRNGLTLSENLNVYELIVGGRNFIPIDPDVPIITGVTDTTTVVLSYDFSSIVNNGTTLYYPDLSSVFYNTSGSLSDIHNQINMFPPESISSENPTLDFTIGSFNKGSDIYLWVSDANYMCGTASTTLQIQVNTNRQLTFELTTTPTKYTIPSNAQSTFGIIMYIQ